MRQWYRAALAAGFTAMVLAGCGGQKPASAPGAAPEGQTPATPDQLVQIWDIQVAKPQEELNYKLSHAIAQDMAQRHPQGIEPILKKIDVEEPTPQAITLTLACTRDLITPQHEALLTELAGPTHGSYTRRVAIDLLGSIDNESVRQKLLEMEKDPDLLISVAAYLARLHLGDAEYVQRMHTYWDNPKVHDASRQEMMRRVPEDYAIDVVDLMAQTVNHPGWSPDVRQRVLTILSMMADSRALDALKSAAENSPEPQLHEFAQKAAAAMEARIKSGGTMETVTGPNGEKISTMPLQINNGAGGSVTLQSQPVQEPAAEAAPQPQ